MKLKKLGNTKSLISSVGLGTMGVGGYFTADRSNDDHDIEMIKFAVGNGLTFIDTAEVYGAGHSEELIGKAVSNIRQNVFIATKVSPEHLSYRDVIAACEGSLKRLKTDWIDLYQVHWPNPSIPIMETISALVKLVELGKIRYIGLSNFSLGKLKETIAIFAMDIVSIQVEYNLFDRTIEEDLLPFCEQNQISVLAYSPLDQGKYSSYEKNKKLIEDMAVKYDKTPAQIILNWLGYNPTVIPIPKAITRQHILQNALSQEFEIINEDYESIAVAFRPNVMSIPVDSIIADKEGLEQFVPTPDQLADDIRTGERIKPIRVARNNADPNKYDLVEGKLRYWAWVMAYQGAAPIPALLR